MEVLKAIVTAMSKTYILVITASALATTLSLGMKRERLFIAAGHDFLVDMDSHKIDDSHKFLTGKCHFGHFKAHGKLRNVAVCKACLRRDFSLSRAQS
jgi:hypothetical protein